MPSQLIHMNMHGRNVASPAFMPCFLPASLPCPPCPVARILVLAFRASVLAACRFDAAARIPPPTLLHEHAGACAPGDPKSVCRPTGRVMCVGNCGRRRLRPSRSAPARCCSHESRPGRLWMTSTIAIPPPPPLLDRPRCPKLPPPSIRAATHPRRGLWPNSVEAVPGMSGGARARGTC